MKKKELTIVTVTYSFDSEVVAIVFDDYKKACDYIKEDFENEKRIDMEENDQEIDEVTTYCKENRAVLATIFSDEVETTTWSVATVVDKRSK